MNRITHPREPQSYRLKALIFSANVLPSRSLTLTTCGERLSLASATRKQAHSTRFDSFATGDRSIAMNLKEGEFTATARASRARSSGSSERGGSDTLPFGFNLSIEETTTGVTAIEIPNKERLESKDNAFATRAYTIDSSSA